MKTAGLTKSQRAAKYRAAHVAAGRRTDGKPRSLPKPCGCRNGCCLLCQRPGDKRYISPAKLAALRADYESGMAAAAVERKYGLGAKSLRSFFARRGIAWRQYTKRQARRVNGCFVMDPPHTPAQIAALVSGLRSVRVPAALKAEWRHWSLARRGRFIAQVRTHLEKLGRKFAPTGRCSANVQRFDYTTPAARAIVAAANAGRNSRTKAMSLRPGSQGLIYRGELWFWAFDGYQRQLHGHESEGRGGFRPFLHRHIYEQQHGAIPAGFTVIHRDGNKNNLAPENLALRSMADCARHNHLTAQCRRAPTPENLARKQAMFERIADRAWATKNRNRLARERQLTATLLQSGPNSRGVLATLLQNSRA